MVSVLEVETFLQLAKELPVLDVRSPGEFKLGHIPGALSFPLFDDQERAEVGTLYKQAGQMLAVERGLEIVGGKMKGMFAEGLSHARGGKLMVHCWRGGKRSESVANLLAIAGLEVYVLRGGYKAYRKWVLAQFELPQQMLVIGGLTGSGKTRILLHLCAQGEHILDLEAHAKHRGSAFGRLGQTGFVSPQEFENGVANEIQQLAGKPYWVEDESQMIGSLTIPTPFFQQKRAAPVFFVRVPDAARLEMLAEDYGSFTNEELAKCIHKIHDQLGGLRSKEALEALAQREVEQVTRILLDYYDGLYMKSILKRSPDQVKTIGFDRFDLDEITAKLKEEARGHFHSANTLK